MITESEWYIFFRFHCNFWRRITWYHGCRNIYNQTKTLLLINKTFILPNYYSTQFLNTSFYPARPSKGLLQDITQASCWRHKSSFPIASLRLLQQLLFTFCFLLIALTVADGVLLLFSNYCCYAGGYSLQFTQYFVVPAYDRPAHISVAAFLHIG